MLWGCYRNVIFEAGLVVLSCSNGSYQGKTTISGWEGLVILLMVPAISPRIALHVEEQEGQERRRGTGL